MSPLVLVKELQSYWGNRLGYNHQPEGSVYSGCKLVRFKDKKINNRTRLYLE
jgi:hypothetical protein